MTKPEASRLSVHLVAGIILLQALLLVPDLCSDPAAATPPSPTSWTKYNQNPLLSPSGGWEGNSQLFSASLVDTGDQFYLYYTAGGVGLATSYDCKSWTRYSGNPVRSSDCNPSVMKDGTTWKMWYSDSSGVCYATSGDGKSWTTVATGVMKYGASGAWDTGIWSVCVIKDGGTYRMYYTGNAANQQIGYATSPDGTTWTKYAGNPVLALGPGGAWDDDDVLFPCVMKAGDEYRMWYAGHDGARVAIGYATSSDGATWTRHAGNPVLSYGAGWDAYATMPTVVQRNSTLEMMYTGVTANWATYRIGLAESFGSTPSAPAPIVPYDDQWTNDSTPTFRWRFGTPSEQSAFQVQLDDDIAFGSPAHDSGKQDSDVTSWTFPAVIPDGTYYWRVKCWDLGAVASYWSPVWKLKLDATAPKNPAGLASTSHAIGVWSGDSTVEAGWSLPPGGGDISGYLGFATAWDTDPHTVPAMLDLQDPGATSTTSPPSGDTNGLYFHIRAKDRAGNWATGAAHLGPFSVDATPPLNPSEVSSTSHRTMTWSTDDTIDMAWSEPDAGASGADGFSYLWDRQRNTLPQPQLNATADARDATSFRLADGSDWYFHLRTKDLAGNWAPSAVHVGPFWIDTNPPVVLNLSVNGGAEFATCQTVRAIWRAEDARGGSGLSGVRWKLNDDAWGTWENYSNSTFIELDRGDGEYHVHVQVRDLANNTSPPSFDTIVLDRGMPVGASVGLDGGARYTRNATVRVDVTASDPEPGSGLWEMSFSDDGRTWEPWVPFNESCARNLTAGDGDKTVYVRLRDRAGNEGPSASATIMLDTVPPVTYLTMLPGTVDDLSFNVTWTAGDSTSGVAMFFVQYQEDGGEWRDWLAGTCQTSARFTGRDNHTYRFRALAEDRAGNREAAYKAQSDPVRIKLPYPVVSMVKPQSGAVLSGRFVAFGTAGHPKDDSLVVLVEVRIDDGPWKPARGTLDWSYVLDTASLMNGRHNITVRSFDGARYSEEAFAEFEVRNEQGLTIGGLTLPLLVLIAALAAVGAGLGFYLGRKGKRAPAAPSQTAWQAAPPLLPPLAAGPRPTGPAAPPFLPAPPALPPEAAAPSGGIVVERTVSVSELERDAGEPDQSPQPGAAAPGAASPEAAPPVSGPPEPPRRARTAEEERAMRESKVLQALSSLPRGLPSSLWGIEMDDLASRVVMSERRVTDDGDILVKIGNRWYFGDETNLGLFMQQYKD